MAKNIEVKMAYGVPDYATDEKRLQVSAFLRSADKFIKEGHYEQARIELHKAREIDPNNAYALAFTERIASLETQAAKETAKSKLPSAQPTAVEPSAKAVEQKPQLVSPPVMPPKTEVKQAVKEPPNVEVFPFPAVDERKLEAGRARLKEQFEQEKAKTKEQLEKAFELRLQKEHHEAELQYQQRLESERQRVEKETRIQLETQHALQVEELKTSFDRERTTLAEKEKQSLSLATKEQEADFAGRLTKELEKFKKSSTTEEKELRTKLEETLRNQLQGEFEIKLQKEHAAAQEQNEKREKEIAQSFKEQHEFFRKESEKASAQKLKELDEREAKRYEQKKAELQQSLETQFQAKLKEVIAVEKEKLKTEKDAVEEERRQAQAKYLELKQRQTELETQRVNETTRQVEQAKREVAQTYERRMELLGIHIPKTIDERMKLYYDRIREAWAIGPITVEKAQALMELQELLGISFEEHAECESNVRVQLYADSLEQAILGGKIRATDKQALDDLKRRYDITIEEAAKLEPIILSAFQRSATKASVLIVDDDLDLAELIRDRLQEQGYKPIVYDSIGKALEFLATAEVDLILSDLRFQAEKMDGFTFYKEIQKNQKLRKVPFVLMTSMDEGLFMRTGVQLGIDDYLTKPLDLELLVAIVEGKLRKYKSLRED